MKQLLICLFTAFLLTSTAVIAHDYDMGPNGGVLVMFGEDGALFGEVMIKDGKTQMQMFEWSNEDLKPIVLDKQVLDAIRGDRENPMKLTVEKTPNCFLIPEIKVGEELVIFQFKPTPDAEPITGRLQTFVPH
jgi:hypothetical protein